MNDLLTVGDLQSTELPHKMRVLAERLAKIHGGITAAREANGIQLYMACPHCLELEGERALQKKKFSVNATRYFVADRWALRAGTYDVERSASCLKCKKAYSVSELLGMPPLSERGFTSKNSDVVIGSLARKLVPDGKGNWVPPGPGSIVALTSLPPEHPGRWYLEQRGYDLELLQEQFQAGWCYKELPSSFELSIFYKNLPMGFKSTPQGRIIFFASINGAIQSWQGRIPEFVEGNLKSYWHPYQDRWVVCEVKEWDDATQEWKWNPIPQIKASPLDWDLPKYRTAKHTARNEVLFGFDAAVHWNKMSGKSTILLVEGPLDAARFGPPAIALIGSFISPFQASLILNNFRRVVYIRDKGKAGEDSLKTVNAQLGGKCDLIFEELPEGVNDPGALPQAAANAIYLKYLL